MNRILKKLTTARLALMAALFGSALSATADESVYISDFSIKAGEQKEIAINLDTDSKDLKYIEGTIKLPAGLVLVEGAYEGASWKSNAKGEASRAKDPYANMNPATGKIIIAAAEPAITGDKGAIGYITVISNRYLAETSKIQLSDVKAVKTDGTAVNVPGFTTTVTRSTPLAWLDYADEDNAITMKAGESADVEVVMRNVVDITFLQSKLSASEGLTIAGVKKSDRVKVELWNDATDVYIIDTISGDRGTVFTVTLKADAKFSGKATLTVSDAVASDPDAVTYKPAAIVLDVTVEAAFEPLFADGKYYFQETATGKFLAAGHSWGTQAIVNEDGLDYTVAVTPEGKYTLDSRVSNGGNNHFLNANPLYNDQGAFGWTIAKTEDGAYTLSNGTQFVAVDEEDNLILTDDAEKAAQWKVMTYEERYKTLAAATKKQPVDATFTVQDAGFNRNDQRVSAWEGDSFGVNGDATDTNAEKWGGNSQTFDIHQTVEVPNGIYKITWNGFYRYNNTTDNTNDIAVAAHADGTEVINSFVYVNDQDFALTSIADEKASEALEGKIPFSQGEASAAFGQGLYAQSADVIVTDGKLTLGIKKTDHPGTDWTVWDNFRVTYLGPDYLLDPDTYYIQHVATGKYLAAGHDWGTRAIVNNDGLDYITTVTPDGKYNFDSQVSNGGNSHFLNANPLYNDQGAYGWTVEKTNDGNFTISNGTELLTVDADDNCALTTENDGNAVWKFVTYEERLKSLEKASRVNPVSATFTVQDANFGRNDQRKSAWKVVAGNPNLSGGNNVNNNAESYMAAYEVGQTVYGLPNGLYKVEAQGAVTFHDNRVIKEYDGNGYPVIFANDKTSDYKEMLEGDRLSSMSKMSEQFTAGEYELEPIEVEVTDGTLTVGTKSDRADIWAVWDNFRVTYLGPAAGPDEELAEAPAGWHSVISNGNLAKEENVNFYTKENNGAPVLGTIISGIGKNYSRGLYINTPDNPGTEWDAQFFIKSDEIIPAGHKIHVEFDYMATQEAGFDTQSHAQPSDYIHWYCVGSGNATPVWQHYSAEVEVSKAKDDGSGDWGKACTNPDNGKPFQTVAFNLCKVTTATTFFFDNIIFWVSDVDVAVKDIKVINAETGDIYDLRGRKVEGALRKGVYIQNGRKIMVK